MIMTFAARLFCVLTLLAPLVLALRPTETAAQAQGAQEQAAAASRQQPAPSPPSPLNFGAQQEKINAWTIGLAAGQIEGAPLRLASEMARVIDDGPNLHVLPIVTRGPTENLNSLLYLRGVDLAIINADALKSTRSSSRKSGATSPTCSTSSRPSFTSSSDPRSRACRTRRQEGNFNTQGRPPPIPVR